MIRQFAILEDIENYGVVKWGVLYYNTVDITFTIELVKEVPDIPNNMPLSIGMYWDLGIYYLNEEQARDWVDYRVIPPNRQGLSDCMRVIGVDYYDILAFLLYNNGRCVHDEAYLEEIIN